MTDGLMLKGSPRGQHDIRPQSNNAPKKTHTIFTSLTECRAELTMTKYVSGQICPTWERKGYKWLRGCGEITLWKKDQDWTSLVFYRLRKRIRKQSVAVGWRDNLSCFKSLHSWSNDCNRSLAARGRRRGIQSKHTDTWLSYHKLKLSQMRITYYEATNIRWESKALFSKKWQRLIPMSQMQSFTLKCNVICIGPCWS